MKHTIKYPVKRLTAKDAEIILGFEHRTPRVIQLWSDYANGFAELIKAQAGIIDRARLINGYHTERCASNMNPNLKCDCGIEDLTNSITDFLQKYSDQYPDKYKRKQTQ